MKNVLNLKNMYLDFKLFFPSKSYVLDHSESIVLQGRGGGLESQ